MDFSIAALIIVIAMLGSFMQSTAGFGYAVICMALMPLIIPFRSAVVIEVFTAFVLVLIIAIKLRKHINFRLILWPALSAILVSNLGIFTLMISNERNLRVILGLVLVILSFYFIFWGGNIRVKPNVFTGLAAGALSGFFGGLLGIGGPPMAAYLLSTTDDKMEYSATLQCFFVVVNIYIMSTHIFLGNVNIHEIMLGGAAILGLGVGIFLGIKVFRRLSIVNIRKFVYVFMAVAGVYLVIT